MSGTLVLGGGFGGIACAVDLARSGEPVTLVEAAESFTMGLVALRALDGRSSGAEHARPYARLEARGFRVLRRRVTRIDPRARSVETDAGALTYDRLVVALGARLAPERIVGLPTRARNVYDIGGARALHADLAALRDGAHVLLVAHSMPFKCPPAPYEAACIVKGMLDARGVRAEVTIATPEPFPIPVFGAQAGAFLRKTVEARGVAVRNGMQLAGFEDEKTALFADGSRLAFDALGIVPPHVAPEAVAALAGPSGWIEVDAATLQTPFDDVWAIGDCTLLKLPVGKPMPKAGVLAEAQGMVVARNVAARAGKRPETARFEGRGTCYIELGDGTAIEGRGDFFASPPTMAPAAPSAETLRAKERFEAERLATWFDDEATSGRGPGR